MGGSRSYAALRTGNILELRSFDRVASLDKLTSLTELQRAAYAIACAERLIPIYDWFEVVESWGDSRILRRGLEVAWCWVRSEVDAEQVADAITGCEEATPDTEDYFSSGLASRALDAASAIAQALETCLRPSPETALEAGEIAWECAFGLEQSRTTKSGEVNIADSSVLREASKGDLVQLEESLQAQSLEALQNLELTIENIDAFRARYGRLEKH